jgi:hypothetical protein
VEGRDIEVAESEVSSLRLLEERENKLCVVVQCVHIISISALLFEECSFGEYLSDFPLDSFDLIFLLLLFLLFVTTWPLVLKGLSLLHLL